MKERDLVERYLCLDIVLEVDSNSDMLMEYQSVTERMRKLKLQIEHEYTTKYEYGFMIRNEKHEKKQTYTTGHLIYLVKRTLKEFNEE